MSQQKKMNSRSSKTINSGNRDSRKNIIFLRQFFTFCLFITSLSMFGQQGLVVKGKVTDLNGDPLIGANILEIGTLNGTISDYDGSFEITLQSDDAKLSFTYIGYLSKEIVVGNQSDFEVVLEEDAAQLDEVVVVGYGTQKKINLTGSVSTVQSEELAKVPVSNVGEALQGKAPGLFIKQSQGVPGQDLPEIGIRGFGAPLVLVDGVQADWNRMDPNEIESISILKDASAAIYGARAGNGVILITTKRGKTGKASIVYSNNFTFQTPTVRPNFVPSWQLAELLREGELNNQLPFTYTEEEVQKFKEGTDPNYPNENWYDAAFQDWSLMQQHNVSVSGGTEKSKYFLTTGYLHQDGLYKSGDLKFQRYNVRSNMDVQINERLTASFDLAFRNEFNEIPRSAQIGGNDLGNVWNSLKTAKPYFPATLPDPSRSPYSGFLSRSPVSETISDITGSEKNNERFFFGRIGLSYKIPGIEGLELKADLNYTSNEKALKSLDRPYEVFGYNFEGDQYTSFGLAGTNRLDEETSRFTRIYPLISLNYENSFGNHDVGVLLLGEGIDEEYTFLSGGRIDLLSSDIPYLFSGSTENVINNSGAVETGRVSYVGRLNYGYKNKYLFKATLRLDASHKFPTDSRWGTFPSFEAAWRISEESFIKNNSSFIDLLKIRASYSKSGNDNVEAFKYLTGYEILTSSSSVYLFGDNIYRQIRNIGLPNPQITWLDNTTYNIGLDATFAKGKLGMEFDVFYRLTENIFGQPTDTYPSTFGAVLPQLNLNSTEDRGFELTLNHRGKINESFNYQLSGLFSYARTKNKKFAESPYDDPDEIRIFQQTGQYTNRWIGYRSDGLFMSQDEINNHGVDQDQAENSTLRPGDIKYVDLNGDNVIDWRDQEEIGYGTFPNLTFGFNIQLDYKGFSMTALFQGASLFNNNITDIIRGPLSNDANAYDFQYKYRWQPDPNNPSVNINPDAQLPAIQGDLTGTNTNNNRTSDFWLKDGTYTRLRNLNIGYDLPNNVSNRLGFNGIRVSLSGTNLFTWNRLGIYDGAIDPEQTTSQKFYPPNKTISLGVNIKL